MTFHDVYTKVQQTTDASDETMAATLSLLAIPTTLTDTEAWILHSDPAVTVDALYHCSACPAEAGVCPHVLAVMIHQHLEEDPLPVITPRLVLPPTLPMRSIQAIVTDLSRPLPASCIAQKPAKNKKTGQITQLDFLHWQTVTRLLHAYAPGWSGHISKTEQVSGKYVVHYRITIPCLEGTATMEASGQEDDDVGDYGDFSSNAEAMAFKRAAAKFGLGAYLYDKDHTAEGLAHYMKSERQFLLQTLADRLDAVGLDRATAMTWLKAQTGITATSDLPASALRTLAGLLPPCSAEATHAPTVDTTQPSQAAPPPPPVPQPQAQVPSSEAVPSLDAENRQAIASGFRVYQRESDGMIFVSILSPDLPKEHQQRGIPIWEDALVEAGLDPEAITPDQVPDIQGWGFVWREYLDKKKQKQRRVDTLINPTPAPAKPAMGLMEEDDIPF